MPMFKPLVLTQNKGTVHFWERLARWQPLPWPPPVRGVHLARSFASCLLCVRLAKHQTWLLKRAFNLNLLHKIE